MKDNTKALHIGYEKDMQKTMSVPIYQTTAYQYEGIEHAARLFSLEEKGNIYTRLTNPTTEILEKRIASLEEGIEALVTGSGMGAVFYAVANVVEAGDTVLASTKLYGGTITLLTQTLKKFGIKVKFFDVREPESLKEVIDVNCKAVLVESVANPALAVPAFKEIIEISDKHNLLTIVDNTIPTPFGCKPLKLGADIVVHSTSKYMVGNGTAIGGVLVEGKSAKEKLKNHSFFCEKDESYNGLIYNEVFDAPFIARARLALLRDFGSVASPFNSWLTLQGIETLGLRIEKHSKSALGVAQFLESHEKALRVHYPFLKSSPDQANAERYLTYAGGVVSFEVESYDFAIEVVKNLDIFSLVTNIGDSKSLVTHPASTTHQQLSKKELEEAGVPEGLIRLSIGLEDVEDLIEALDKALGTSVES